MRKCLFCENPAKTREHIWPEWVLKRLNVREPIHQKMGNEPAQLLPNPEQKVKAVCGTCNNGWMHELENLNIPLIGNLMQDVAFALNGLQQYQLATWAVKMSMIGDFLARSQRPLFFDQVEREQLRVANNLPDRTQVWIARYAFPDHVGIWGTNSWALDMTVHAFITTVVVGHLVVQVLTAQCFEKWDGIKVNVEPRPGPLPWPQLVTGIWPTVVSAAWPPTFSFNDDTEFSVFRVIRRFSYGEDLLSKAARSSD